MRRNYYREQMQREREERREAQLAADEVEEAERSRLAQRSTWEKVNDLDVSDDLKSLLWAITEKLDI